MIHLEHRQLEAYAIQMAKEGNHFCGDSFYMTANDDFFLCVLADGLGSGEHAHESSQAVTSVVQANPEEDVHTLMDYSNKVLLSKRGAAVAILKADFARRIFEYSCVGNIRFFVYTPSGHLIYPMPMMGYLSGRPQKIRTQTFSYEPESRFLIHSDGFAQAESKKLLNSYASMTALAKKLKSSQANKADDVTFIVGNLL
jgi:negative regulator of sigma-B (phosphoserine phosphatase)